MHSCFHVRNFSFEKFEFDEKFNLEKPRAAQNNYQAYYLRMKWQLYHIENRHLKYKEINETKKNYKNKLNIKYANLKTAIVSSQPTPWNKHQNITKSFILPTWTSSGSNFGAIVDIPRNTSGRMKGFERRIFSDKERPI